MANATHGLRRTVDETRNIVRLALQHPNAQHLSNVELAAHIHLPEPTLRRWRKRLSSSPDEDAIRTVCRGGTVYQLETRNIGKMSKRSHAKRPNSLTEDIEIMKDASSPEVRPQRLYCFKHTK